MTTKYKYGSPEYLIEEAKKELDKALVLVLAHKQEFGEAQPLEDFKTSLRNLEYYYSYGYYRPTFDKGNKDHIEKAFEKAKAAAEEELKFIEGIKERNAPKIEANKKLRENISKIMTLAGIGETFSKWEKPPRKKNFESVKYSSGYTQDLQRVAPIVCNAVTWTGRVKDILQGYIDTRKKLIADIEKAEKEKASKDTELLKLAAAINLAKEFGIEYKDNDELLEKVNSAAQVKWISENYPYDTHLEGGCQECESWSVGDPRCECGNRRIYLEVEGDFLTGYSAYPVAY